MAYMRKNVNIFLLVVVVIIVVSLAAITSYYQTTYKNLSTNYETKLNEINNLIDDLNSERTKLNETSYELTLKAEREEKLGAQYTEVKGEKEKLAGDLSQTEKELERTKLNLQSTISDYQKLQYDYGLVQKQVDDQNKMIAKLQAARAELLNDLQACQAASS